MLFYLQKMLLCGFGLHLEHRNIVKRHKEKLELISLSAEEKAAARSRAVGLAIALLLFAFVIYIATFARFGS